MHSYLTGIPWSEYRLASLEDMSRVLQEYIVIKMVDKIIVFRDQKVC